MFNGIIEEMGVIHSIAPTPAGGAILFVATVLASRLRKGDSLAVDGVCLTVTARKSKRLRFDLARETLDRSNLKYYMKGGRVNLEVPIIASTMISGHFVQGHIEGVAKVKAWTKKGREDVRLMLELPKDILDYCVPKGSIALNGVSLTIASLRKRLLEVALIPFTLQKTNLGDLKPGDPVNVETDVIGRYVVSALKKDYAKILNKRGR